jgi:hypothetical protein
VRRLSPLLLVVVPALALLGIVRAVGGIHRAAGGTWREAIGALGIWLALSVTVARACLRGAVEPAGVFLRTPKNAEPHFVARVDENEPARDLPNAGLIAALLVVSAAGYLAAPLNSLAALRADLPERLRRRRATEIARAWTRLAGSTPRRRIGLATLTLEAAVATVVLLAPTLASDSTRTLGQRQRHDRVAAGTTDRNPRATTSSTHAASPIAKTNGPATTGDSTPVNLPSNATPSGNATTAGPPGPHPLTSSDAAHSTVGGPTATPSGTSAPSTSGRTVPAPPTTPPTRTITNPPAATSPTNRPTTTPSPSHSHTAS